MKLKFAGLSLRKVMMFSPVAVLAIGLAAVWLMQKGQPILFPGKTEQVAMAGWEKMQIPGKDPSFFSLKPKTESKYGILPDQAFVLTTLKQTSRSFVEENLKSDVPFKVEQVSAQEFLLTPAAEMKTDQVARINFGVKDKEENDYRFDRDYSFAFQVQGNFRVLTSIPGDLKTDVPVKTGIELKFSQDDYEDPDPYINISPEIKWRGERHAETYAIVPLSPLSPRTVYTVTLKRGLGLKSRRDPISEDYSFTFQTADPEQQTGKISELSLADDFVQVSPASPPLVKVYTNWSGEEEIETEIYRYGTGGQFIASRSENDQRRSYWYRYFANDSPTDLTSLNKMGSTRIKPQEKEDTKYLQLPSALPEGFYLVRFSWAGGKRLEQLWIQSSDLAVYTTVGRDQTLVWVNSLNEGRGVDGARISVEGRGGEFYTSDSGIAVFGTPAELLGNNGKKYLKVEAGNNRSLFVPVSSGGNQGITSDDYWSYIYHERNLYLPTDKVYFWGVAKLRDNGSVPGELKVRLTGGYGEEQTEYAAKMVYPGSDGSYFGYLEFEDLPEGWRQLEVLIGDLTLASSGLQIKTYTKPEMKIEVTTDKRAVFAGEEVKFTAKTSFYDTTPAAKVKLNISSSAGNKTVPEKSTNEAGELNYVYIPEYAGPNYNNYPRYETVTFNPAFSQEEGIIGHGSVMVFGSRVKLETQSEQENEKAKLIAQVHNTDLTNLNNGTSSGSTGSAVTGAEVTAGITKIWYEKVSDGTYYDFIEKVTRPKYRYVKHEEKLPDAKMKTGIDGRTEYVFTMEADRSYEVKVQVLDKDGRPSKASEYFYYYPGETKPEGETARQQGIPQLALNKKENSYSLGETIGATIQLNGEAYKKKSGDAFLFIAARRGRQDYFIKDEPAAELVFEEQHIPNFYLGAVIFTQGRYQPVSGGCQWDWYCYYDYRANYFGGVNVRYNFQDRQLEMSILPDKQGYQPGDTVRVGITVTRSGKPEAGAEVNLAVVDQALAAMGGVKKPTTLSSLYKNVSSYIYYTYFSHRPVFTDAPQAEMGGGGGDFREIFKDTPYFGRQKTDAQGFAEIEFVLPDNLTTWILYAQSVNEEMYAGQAENTLVVSKDFFVTSRFVNEILKNDRPELAAAGFGRKLNDSDKINYEVTFFAGNIQLFKENKTGDAFKEINFPFPKLETGEYAAGLTGKVKTIQDGIKLPFSVIGSRLQLPTSQTYRVNKDEVIEKVRTEGILADKPIILVLSDIGKGQYYYQLTDFCHIASNRLEKRLAGQVADRILVDYYKYDRCPRTNRELSGFQNLRTDGGLAQVNWGGSDLETTLWAIYTDPTPFNRDRLVDYLENKLAESRSEQIQRLYAAWGLSLLSSPRLTELENMNKTASNFEFKVNLALALATLGEKEKARDIYFDLMADFAYTMKPYIRIQRDGAIADNEDTLISDTSRMLLLGSLVEKEYNQGMYLYLRDFNNYLYARDVVTDLGELAFIRQELEKLPEYKGTKVTVSTNVRNETLDLTVIRGKSYQLTAGELPSLKITGVDGKAEIKLYYQVGTSGLANTPGDSRLNISRTLEKAQGSEGEEIRPGDILRIRLGYKLATDSPEGSYVIIDHLPSGLKRLTSPWMYGLASNGYVSSPRNQVAEVRFWYSRSYPRTANGEVVYYARAAAPGEYVAEPAILQSQLDLGVIQKTDQNVFLIGKSK